MCSSPSFNKREEAKVGADWLWWWVGSGGESFGMLVQAKRLYVTGPRWRFLFDHGHGKQRQALWEAAEALDVTPVYVVYLGTRTTARRRRAPRSATRFRTARTAKSLLSRSCRRFWRTAPSS